MATQDVRLELIQHEYSGMRSAVHTLMDRMDGYEAALLGLTEMVAENRERLERLEEAVAQNRELILSNQQHLSALNDKIDRLMTHLDVPPKPPAGFVKE